MADQTRTPVEGVVVYGIGSPLLVDVEESLYRAGLGVCAGVRNCDGRSFLSADIRTFEVDAVPDDIKGRRFIVPLFTPANRQHAACEARRIGFGNPLSLIDPSVATPRAIRIDPGLYVNAGCSLGGGSEFGTFVLINRGAAIGHHARFGRFVSIGPGAVIGGQVNIGDGSMVGGGAVVLPTITIGRNAIVGAGAVVTRDVPDRCVVVGNPARVVKTGIAGYNGKGVE